MLQKISQSQRILCQLKDKSKILVLRNSNSYYACEAICPHAGGLLSEGVVNDIEELVCPVHSYRFNLETGKSQDCDLFTLKRYDVVEQKDGLVLKGINMEDLKSTQIFEFPKEKKDSNIQDNVNYDSPIFKSFKQLHPEMSLVDYCLSILSTPDPSLKVQLTLLMAEKWSNGEISRIKKSPITPFDLPARPARQSNLKFVDPSRTTKRGKGGSVQSRLILLHALANVEQWAIDLAVDIIARFDEDLPHKFYSDFVKMAKEEATHFTFLVERLEAQGSFYGAFPVHEGLWDSATKTSHSLLSRLAIVHMVMEARGLDVNPSTIEKFRNGNDMKSVEYLTRIHKEEITHVSTGQRWFRYLCEQRGLNRYKEFHAQVRQNFNGLLKPPFNEKDRSEAGVDPQYYLPLS